MTITINDGFTQTVAVGGETTIDFDFIIYDQDDLLVFETNGAGTITQLSLGVHYDIDPSDVGFPSGGIITLDSGAYPAGATAGHKFSCYSNLGERRSSDFQQGGDFFSSTLNEQLDQLTIISQQIRRDVDRSPRLPADSQISSVTLDHPEDDAVIAWDGTSGAMKNGPTTAALLAAATAAAASEVACAVSEVNAAADASSASASATSAAQSAAKLSGTSASSVLIGTGSKSFTTQASKFFDVGQRLLITDDADPATNYMFGTVTAYSGTSLTVNVIATGGSGTYTAWTIRVSGERGADGPQGPSGAPGAGTGDVVGPGSATANAIALFDGTTGKIIKDSGATLGSLASLNTINNANWSGTDLSIANGGTGVSTLTQYAVLLGNAATDIQTVSGLGTSGQVLTSNGAGANPTWQTSSVPAASSQSDQETASSTTTYVSPGRQQYHPSSVKCWADVSHSGATPTLTTSYNVTSITDSGTGNLLITIATDFSSANWCAMLGVEDSSWTTTDAGIVIVQQKTAGAVQINFYDVSGNLTDPDGGWQMAGLGDI